MFNKFKNNEKVIVSGIGKCKSKLYIKKVGQVICRDPYYKDYNVKFEDNTEDWFDAKYLKKIEGVEKNENNIHKNKRI